MRPNKPYEHISIFVIYLNNEAIFVVSNVEERQLSLGNIKNRVTGLGAILSQESKKSTARVKQVTRGVWDLK